MKCPKCGYLGFDDRDRCRNCGYDFSLSREVGVPELPLRAETQDGADGFADLSLVAPRRELTIVPDVDEDFDPVATPPAMPRATPGRQRDGLAARPAEDAGEPSSPPKSAPASAPPVAVRTPVTAEFAVTPVPSRVAVEPDAEGLPLFGGVGADDVPLITKASPPRPPLAVRRATPDVPRLRAEAARTPALDLHFDVEVPDSTGTSTERSAQSESTHRPQPTGETAEPADAGLGSRLVAVAIDLLVLAMIDAMVVYFTMQICGLTVADLNALPKIPLLAFLAVQNGGYWVVFTAGGQTLGKMATGIRVVAAGSGSSVDLGRAVLRTVIWVVLAIPGGLGFLSAVFSADHRGLHDRFAGTRVVRASA